MRMPRRQTPRTRLAACSLLILLAVSRPLWAQLPAETFNGGRAFGDLKQLVSYGPRPAGSAAQAQSRSWIIAQLKQTGATVEEDSFTAATPVGQIPMTNLIAKLPGTGSK